MTNTKSNSPIQIEGEVFVLGYDNIASYMNSKQKIAKANRKLVDRLYSEGEGMRVEGGGGRSGGSYGVEKKLMWLYGLGIARIVRFKVRFHLYTYSVVFNGLCN